ncbi:MAG: pyridoxal-phosphate dependent enzyme [Candidatus Dormibacteraeota bacterium]|nr:pyridoxal-phosphate dependent enzyme [Candidatus Dormibacteraeota bacterium]
MTGVEPGFADVLAARGRIRPHLDPSPVRHYVNLSRELGAEVWVKHENMLPTGAFKVRGGINLVSQLSPDERRRGVVSASTGNHGQSVAYAARLFGVRATIYAPAGANRLKVEAMRDLGAEVILEGADFDEARVACERRAAAEGLRYIHSGDEPLLIAGVGTYTLEALEAVPGLDTILVPIGGGSGAAGAAMVAAAADPRIRVVGVQSADAPAAHRAWRSGSLDSALNRTAVEGLATASAFALPQRLLRRLLADFILVEDRQIQAATRLLIEATRTLVEPAGAAALAGALQMRDRLRGRRVCLICSGANITPEQLQAVLSGG